MAIENNISAPGSKSVSRKKKTDAVATPAVHAVDTSNVGTTDTTPVQATPAQLEFLRMICSASPDTPDTLSGGPLDPFDTPFLFSASQVNTDLAQFAVCELKGDLSPDDINSNYFDLLRSPMYVPLRETFIQESAAGNRYALLNLVWRGYNAGLLSPERLKPSTSAERKERVTTPRQA